MNAIEIVPTEFISHDERLRGNFVKPRGKGPFPGICKFHGLPGSADQVHGIATKLAEEGFMVLTFDFRGFRESEGIFSLSGEIDDAENAVTHLLDSGWVTKEWLGVYGASFGGAIAICSAARDSRIRSICIRAPLYDTRRFAESGLSEFILHEVADSGLDDMHGVEEPNMQSEMLSALTRDATIYNPMTAISKITPRPILIITGDSDALIDVDGVTGLYAQAGEPKELIVVEGADHNLSEEGPKSKTEKTVIEWFRRQVSF